MPEPASAECDQRRFQVVVHTTDGETHTYRDQTNQQARGFEDLPFESSNVTLVETVEADREEQ